MQISIYRAASGWRNGYSLGFWRPVLKTLRLKLERISVESTFIRVSEVAFSLTRRTLRVYVAFRN